MVRRALAADLQCICGVLSNEGYNIGAHIMAQNNTEVPDTLL